MNVIILAAGQGLRLRPLTNDRPKCLVPLRGKPLLNYQLDVFRNAGLFDVSLVVGYQSHQLAGYGLRQYCNQAYATTNMVYSLFCAEHAFGTADDIIVSYGDIVFEARILQALLASAGDFSVIVDEGWYDLWALRMPDPLADAETLQVDEQRRILEIGRPATSYEEIQGQYIGLFKISGRAATAVRQFYRQTIAREQHRGMNDRSIDMTSFIDQIARRLLPVDAVFVRHGWLEVDTVADLRQYEKMGCEHRYLFRFPPNTSASAPA